MTEEHSADEAAGEVIYSSDGLPPLSIPRSNLEVEKPDDGDDMTILDTHKGCNAAQAFEVFSGKVYPVGSSAARAAANSNPSPETPAERLARLQQEVAELEQDLGGAAASSEEESPAILELVTDLKRRLQGQTGASSKNQAEMTRSIQHHLQQWEAQKETAAADNTTKPDTTNAAAGVVYELYGGVGVPAASAAPSLEERLLQVETLVGTHSSSTKQRSLLQRLEETETFWNALDPKALERASAKAKVIRSDLEAASKARNKLASAATFRKEDAKTIAALYDQMTQLEGLSEHLPALVARLQQLAHLHAQTSTFSVRLTQSEQQVTELQALVQQFETAIARVETGMVENAKAIEKNMQQLDERIHK